MFGISLSKLIVLVAVVVAVWYGFKWLSRFNEKRKEEDERDRHERDRVDRQRRAAEADRASAAPVAKAGGAEDMESCRVCGTYVMARSARSCGRPECPYPG
ncbi:MAG: hypothetical protein FJX35_23275 [Alphaproteobacteria bacterium]|nr:hypothetical protein [Alphaproteobacteria bacterium]